VNRTITQLGSVDGGIRRSVTGAKEFVREAVLWIAVWHVAFCPGLAGTAFGQIVHFDPTALDPAMRARVQAALVKLKESPGDISAVETLLAIEPRVVEAVGSSKFFTSSDPVRSQALKWSQELQPAEVLVTSLEKGSDAAVHWALRQIVWRRSNDWFDKESLARLMPGIEMALVKPPPATRAQAVRTMMVCLPLEHRTGFLKGLLKGQPDEVMAAAVDEVRQSDPDVEVIVAKWLNASDDPLLLRACCTYWWLVKSQSTSDVKESEIVAFERLAGHQEATVRRSVTLAVQAAATPSGPRMVGILLRLTFDEDSSVNWNAARALRNANTLAVNARLRELFATGQPPTLRAAAIEVLGIFGKDNLPLILSAAKADKDPSVRQNAVYALRQIGTPEAAQGLEAARRDPDEGVRREAQTQFEWFRREHPTRQ
jgi:HEAT repeat protein